MTFLANLAQMTPDQLRALAAQLMSKVNTMGRKIHHDQTLIEQLTHEIAVLKRHRFAKRSEQISSEQGNLLDDLLNTDFEAIDAELSALLTAPAPEQIRQKPKRAPLPAQFPSTVILHEPENTQCSCRFQLQRIGEDVSEKLDYMPGVFTVEQYVRGKWACRQCETLIQAPVPAQVINKGIPTAGLLAHVIMGARPIAQGVVGGRLRLKRIPSAYISCRTFSATVSIEIRFRKYQRIFKCGPAHQIYCRSSGHCLDKARPA